MKDLLVFMSIVAESVEMRVSSPSTISTKSLIDQAYGSDILLATMSIRCS